MCTILPRDRLGLAAMKEIPAAAERRQQAAKEEEGPRRDQIAHYLAHIRGKGVTRAGEAFSRN